MSKKNRYIGASYQRVSDDESAKTKSLGNQEYIGQETADILSRTTGIPHVIEYVLTEKDGKSGGNTNRPEYKKLWDLIALRRIDFITAKDISRLNRSIKDFCCLVDHCKKNNVTMHIKGLDLDLNSPMGDLIYKLLALIAEFERTLIVQRTKAGVRAGMLKGRIHGGRVALGFDKDPESTSGWATNKSELKQVERVLDLVCQHDSLKTISAAIAVEGIVNKCGTPFGSESLKRLVRNKKYEGILEVNDDGEALEIDLDFGPVVDLNKLADARAKVKEIEAKFSTKTRVRKRTNLLAGILEHADGTPFRGTCGTSKTGIVHNYYRNDRHKLSIVADVLEDAVINAIACYRDDAEIQQYVGDAVGQLSTHTGNLDSQIQSVRSRSSSLKQKEGKLLDMAIARSEGDVGAWLQEQLGTIRAEKADLDQSQQKLEREKASLERNLPNIRDMKKTLEYVFKNFRKAEPSAQRNFIRQLFDKIVVSGKNEINLFWRFPACDEGGMVFALEGEWGG